MNIDSFVHFIKKNFSPTSIVYSTTKAKNIISKNFSAFFPNLFELFHQLISKPSLVNIPLTKIFDVFENNLQLISEVEKIAYSALTKWLIKKGEQYGG